MSFPRFSAILFLGLVGVSYCVLTGMVLALLRWLLA